MRITKTQINALKDLIKKLEEDQKKERIRINARRKAQLKGKTINKRIQRARKPTSSRRPTKRRASIR